MTRPKPRLGPKHPSVLKPVRWGVYQIGIVYKRGHLFLLYSFWDGESWGPFGWNPSMAKDRYDRRVPGMRLPPSWWRGVRK